MSPAQAAVPYPNPGGFVFPATKDTPVYRDVLWLTPVEAATLPESRKQAMMQERYDNWRAAIKPSPPVIPTATSLSEDIASIDAQIRELTRQRLYLEEQLVAVEAPKPIVS